MIYSQINLLLKESECSPEELGNLIGISGMTLRRWLKRPKNESVPAFYAPAIREACYQLIAQDRLRADSPVLASLLRDAHSHQLNAALKHLGLSRSFVYKASDRDSTLLGLTQIGAQEDKQQQVTRSKKRIFSYRAMGAEWSRFISTLWTVIQSPKLVAVDKLVAYGALFYLVTPIDFIPDHVPFFGLLDDYAVLGIAAGHYLRKLRA